MSNGADGAGLSGLVRRLTYSMWMALMSECHTESEMLTRSVIAVLQAAEALPFAVSLFAWKHRKLMESETA